MTKVLRPIRYEGDIAYVPLTGGLEAIVDLADVHLVEGHNWYARRKASTSYAVRKGHDRERGPSVVLMHRAIVGATDMPCIDHADGNGLNNRRENLRPCSHKQNTANRKKTIGKFAYIGVRARYRGRWSAQISIAGRLKFIGTFETAEAAARAYDALARSEHGQFASLNFPEAANG